MSHEQTQLLLSARPSREVSNFFFAYRILSTAWPDTIDTKRDIVWIPIWYRLAE
jgi:hypothetical protein